MTESGSTLALKQGGGWSPTRPAVRGGDHTCRGRGQQLVYRWDFFTSFTSVQIIRQQFLYIAIHELQSYCYYQLTYRLTDQQFFNCFSFIKKLTFTEHQCILSVSLIYIRRFNPFKLCVERTHCVYGEDNGNNSNGQLCSHFPDPHNLYNSISDYLTRSIN